MEPVTLPIYNLEGQEIDRLTLDASVFDGRINQAAIYQVLNSFLSCQRRGLASTKGRGEVSGGGRKPWKQKGTGRARHGSSRSPIWRHGGVTFGPQPRDFSYEVNKKIKQAALKSGLNAKVKENNLTVVEEFKVERPKVKDAVGILSSLKLSSGRRAKKNSILILLDKVEKNTRLALRNISFLNFNLAKDTHAYEVVLAQKILITKNGLKQLVERIKR
ncbi:MAG: 50S ribosomal protein L4 [Candidatus Omnitrophota bacterium]